MKSLKCLLLLVVVWLTIISAKADPPAVQEKSEALLKAEAARQKVNETAARLLTVRTKLVEAKEVARVAKEEAEKATEAAKVASGRAQEAESSLDVVVSELEKAEQEANAAEQIANAEVAELERRAQAAREALKSLRSATPPSVRSENPTRMLPKTAMKAGPNLPAFRVPQVRETPVTPPPAPPAVRPDKEEDKAPTGKVRVRRPEPTAMLYDGGKRRKLTEAELGEKEKEKKEEPTEQMEVVEKQRSTMIVTVAAQDKLMINGHETTSLGPIRTFNTPVLESTKSYDYEFTVIPSSGGDRYKKKVRIKGGQTKTVDLTNLP
jgi:uncharacterized protein (TIGR03000 family)